jgi:hypothetical protein
MKVKKTGIILMLFLQLSCKDDCNITSPTAWLDSMINIGSDSNGKYISVYSYQYNGKVVYLINYEVKCCDIFTSQLFDDKGNSLCFPYGGVTGQGDNKCEEFDKGKSNEKRYWVRV